MQIRFDDTEVKNIVSKYVREIYPAMGDKELSAEGYVGEIRVNVTDKPQPQPEQF